MRLSPATPLAFCVLALAPHRAATQALSLRDALEHADRSAFAVRAAHGNVRAASADVTAALQGILPTLRLESGVARTTDPIGAFGTTLRQRILTSADFDPTRLNHPAPITNYAGAIVLEQPLLNGDAWVGRAAAARGADAAEASAEWTRLGSRADIVRAWYGAVLAGETVGTLEAALTAARAHRSQAESMVRQGMATPSDALLASVKAGEVEAQLADARAQRATARRLLALAIGDIAADVALPGALPASSRLVSVVAVDTMAALRDLRADVAAAERAHDASRLDLDRARTRSLPRINGVVRYDWNSAARLYGGERSWSVGVMATWTPFAGAGDLAQRQAASGREATARAMLDAATARADVEREQTLDALRAALLRLHIADRGVAQSDDAHRIVERKYAGGLASVVELLDAAATRTRAALDAAAARYAVIDADVARRKALGFDPGALALLDDPGPVARRQP